MRKFILFILLPFVLQPLMGQEVDSLIRLRVDGLVAVDSRFENQVDISVGRISLADLLRNVAQISGVNLIVKGGEGVVVSCNFSKAKISDLILFLVREYSLDFDVVGNIVSVFPKAIPLPEKREPKIIHGIAGNTLTYDLRGEPLIEVCRKIGSLMDVNIVIPQSLHNTAVSGYVSQMPFDEAISTLASINGLSSRKSSRGVWNIFSDETKAPLAQFRPTVDFSANELSVDSLGIIAAQIDRGQLGDIVAELCRRQGLNYYFISPINIQTAIYVRGVTFEGLLDVIFTGTQFSYYIDRGIYFFGSSSAESVLASVEIVPLNFRSVDKIADIIPAALKSGVQITQFSDLNSLVLSGKQSSISRVVSFVESIDRPVPLITIDIMIVDSKKNNVMEAGVSMGLSDTPVATRGTLSPGIDMTLGSSSVNNLINSFNGFGSINIGKVTPNFYMSLKLLEENGTIDLRSTPKLSTLNGHQATMQSGETQYYKEISNNYVGTQNPIQTESYTWKSVAANLNIKITPYVSQDKHITMEIEIEQTEFTGREEKNAPPGTATRSFKSLVKVQNEDMVLLGGIDRNMREKSASGLPFISRIPILKWIFGQSKDNKSDHKLNVFIKPTIIK